MVLSKSAQDLLDFAVLDPWFGVAHQNSAGCGGIWKEAIPAAY
jgi:hypothetical protein